MALSSPSKGGQQPNKEQQHKLKNQSEKVKNATAKWNESYGEIVHDKSQRELKSQNIKWGETEVKEHKSIHDTSRPGGPFCIMSWDCSKTYKVDVASLGRGQSNTPYDDTKVPNKERASILMQNDAGPGHMHPFVSQDYYNEKGLDLPNLAYKNVSDLQLIQRAILIKWKDKHLVCLTGHDGTKVMVTDSWAREHVKGFWSIDQEHCRREGKVFEVSDLVESADAKCDSNERNKYKYVHMNYYDHTTRHKIHKLPPSAFNDLSNPKNVESAVPSVWRDIDYEEKETVVKGKKHKKWIEKHTTFKIITLRGHDGSLVVVDHRWARKHMKVGCIDLDHCRETETRLRKPAIVFDTTVTQEDAKANLHPFVSKRHYNVEEGGDFPSLAYKDLSDLSLIRTATPFAWNDQNLVKLKSCNGDTVVVRNEWAEKHVNEWIDQNYCREESITLLGAALMDDLNAVLWNKMQFIRDRRGRVLCKMLDSRRDYSQWIFVYKRYATENLNSCFLKELENTLESGQPVEVPLGQKTPSPTHGPDNHRLASASGSPLDSGTTPSQASVPSYEFNKPMQFKNVCVQEDEDNCVAVAMNLVCQAAARKRPEWARLSTLGEAVYQSWEEGDKDGEILGKIKRLAAEHNCYFLKGQAKKPNLEVKELKPLVGAFNVFDPNSDAHQYPVIAVPQLVDGTLRHAFGHYDQHLYDGKDCTEPVPCNQENMDKSCRGKFVKIHKYYYILPKPAKKYNANYQNGPTAPSLAATKIKISSSSKQVVSLQPKSKQNALTLSGGLRLNNKNNSSNSGSGGNALAVAGALGSSRFRWKQQKQSRQNNRRNPKDSNRNRDHGAGGGHYGGQHGGGRVGCGHGGRANNPCHHNIRKNRKRANKNGGKHFQNFKRMRTH